MKRFFSLMMAAVLCAVSVLPVFATAESKNSLYEADTTQTEVTYFEDGSSLTITTAASKPVSCSTYASGGTPSYTRKASRTCYYKGANGSNEWEIVLYGTFVYNHYTATCTASSATHHIYNNHWKLKSLTADKTGNSARAKYCLKYYTLGVPTNTKEDVFRVSCDKNGKIY